MIYIVDYGMGNLRSVQKAFLKLGAKAKITSIPSDFKNVEKVVFPGVGAFGDAMKELKKRRLIEPLLEHIQKKRFFLGLCLGMQLLFETSDEAKGVEGLGIIKGKVKKFKLTKNSPKVPHMGWNSLELLKKSPLFKGVKEGSYVYFVHSYYAQPVDKNVITSSTSYGIEFPSSIAKENIFAMQFHPEKSQDVGLGILKNFINL